MSELRPCAHCGSRGELVTYYDFYHVNCTNDDCVEHYDDSMVYHGTGAWYGSIADAIAAWNTRAATTIGKAQVEVEPVLRGTLTAEQVREAIFNGSGYASFDGAKYYADGIGMQAIADELNAKLDTRADDYRQAAEYWKRMYEEAFAERTCSNVDDAAECGYFKCSKCNAECSIEWCYSGYGVPSYCPNCGAHVLRNTSKYSETDAKAVSE